MPTGGVTRSKDDSLIFLEQKCYVPLPIRLDEFIHYTTALIAMRRDTTTSSLRSFNDTDFGDLRRLYHEGVLSESVNPPDPAHSASFLQERYFSRPCDHLWGRRGARQGRRIDRAHRR